MSARCVIEGDAAAAAAAPNEMLTVGANLHNTDEQPIGSAVHKTVPKTTETLPKTTRPPSRHLTTFKGNSSSDTLSGSNNNNNDTRDITWKSLSIIGANSPRVDNSLESINSRYSISSANDSCQQPLTSSPAASTPSDQVELAPHNCARSLNVCPASSGPAERSAGEQTNRQLPASLEGRKDTSSLGCKHLQVEPFDGRFVVRNESSSKSQCTQGETPEAKQHQHQNSSSDPKPPFKFAGIVASLAASVLFSFSYVFIKQVPDQSYQGKSFAIFTRGLSFLVLCSVAIIIRKERFVVGRGEIWVNFLRCIFGTLGVYFSYVAVRYISVGDMTALIFSSPIWTSILSHLILKEPLKMFNVIALPLSIFGIVLIAHPTLIVDEEHLSLRNRPHQVLQPATPSLLADNSTGGSFNGATTTLEPATNVEFPASDESDGLTGGDHWIGVAISLAGSIFVSCTYITLKFRKTTAVQTTTFWFGAMLVLFALLIMCFIGVGDMPTDYELVLYFSSGFFSWLAQIALQWAFLYEKAGVLSIVRTMDVALTFALSAIVLDDDIYWTSLLGSAIISAVVVSIMLSDYISSLACCARFTGGQSRADADSLPGDFIDDFDDHDSGQKSRASKLKEALSCNTSGNLSSYSIDDGKYNYDSSKTQSPLNQIYRSTSKA